MSIPSLIASILLDTYVCPLPQLLFDKFHLYYNLYILGPNSYSTRFPADNRSPNPQAPGMPPKNSLTSSFSASDPNNEVVCPLKNNDGSNCRKRCLGVSTDIRKQWADFIRLKARGMLTTNSNFRRSVTDPCKSTYEGHTQNTTLRSYRQLKRASSS